MSKENSNHKELKRLFERGDGNIILFLGAGLSVPLFPSWKDLLNNLIELANDKGKIDHYDELKKKVELGIGYLDIAEYCADSIGESEYREFIENNFSKEIDYDVIPEAYKIIADYNCKCIITTNYDKIPEVVFKGKVNCFTNENIPEAQKAINKGQKVVIKVHGDILKQESIVLKSSDFSKLLANVNVTSAMRSLFSTSTVCFLGFSFSDPFFTQTLEYLNTINNNKGIIHYAILAEKSKFEIQTFEKKHNLRIVDYVPTSDSHPEFLAILKSLKTNNAKQNKKADEPVLNSSNEILGYLKDVTKLLAEDSFILNYDINSNMIVIDYFTNASSKSELQKEVLSLYRLFDISSDIVETISINILRETKATTMFIEYNPYVISLTIGLKSLKKYLTGEVSEKSFWDELTKIVPQEIGTLHSRKVQARFPYINF